MFHLVAKPRCTCLGGIREHQPLPLATEPEMVYLAKTVKCQELEEAERKAFGFVCVGFALEGIAQTDWPEHGSCEMWTPKQDRKRP